jgi:GMP reductase
MQIRDGIKLDFSDVLIEPKRSTLKSRSTVDLDRYFKTTRGYCFGGIPIIAANMSTGTFNMLDVFKQRHMFVAIAKHLNSQWYDHINDDKGISYGFYTIGMNDDELAGLKGFYHVLDRELKPHLKICVDIANGYTQQFADFIRKVRKEFTTNVIIAGNVCTAEMTQELILAGADFVKIGIGPGGACTTRLKTGVGYPQIAACITCADVAHGLNAGIVLDGGMTCAGDIAKAFCANADMVMIGSMLSATDECEGEIITKYFTTNELEVIEENNYPYPSAAIQYKPKIIEKHFKLWYGMSSDYALEKHFGGNKEYRTSEGRIEEIEWKGPVNKVIDDILGGLRSACTYIGSSSIKHMGKCATFIRVTKQHNRF